MKSGEPVSLSNATQKAAMWLLYIVDPYVSSPPTNGSEQNMPLPVAIIFVVLELAVIGLLLTAVGLWLAPLFR